MSVSRLKNTNVGGGKNAGVIFSIMHGIVIPAIAICWHFAKKYSGKLTNYYIQIFQKVIEKRLIWFVSKLLS